MKIAHITPGTGGQFYCQNCFRDGVLLEALQNLGHEVVKVPLYLPLDLDHHQSHDHIPVFYGAINIYLKEKSPLYRHAPQWMESILNSNSMLHLAAKMSGSTTATGLEEMTLSMLKGPEGHQASELDHLIHYLKHKIKPDVVHLSNALLLGIAGKVKADLGCRVICSLQDENEWVDPMSEAYQTKVWNLMAEKAQDVDRFIAASRYYSRYAQSKMNIPESKIEVVYAGIDLEGYENSNLPLDPPKIGYLSRMSDYFGLGILVDAFLKLRVDPQFHDLELHITGGHTVDDKPFIQDMMKKVKDANAEQAVHICETFHKEDRIRFLRDLTLLSVPVPTGEALGTYQIEALAAGVPIVQPNVGGFPEFVEATGGGVICNANDVDDLAASIAGLLKNPDKLKKHATEGKQAVRETFSIENMAKEMMGIYEKVASA